MMYSATVYSNIYAQAAKDGAGAGTGPEVIASRNMEPFSSGTVTVTRPVPKMLSSIRVAP